MIHALSKRIAFLFFNNGEYPIEVYVYGVELIISSLIGKIIVLTLGILLGRLVETLIFIILIKYIRRYSGGFHAKTYIVCNMVFIVSYLISLFISKCLSKEAYGLNIMLMLSVLLVTILAMLILAPIENKNKPIPIEHRRILKLKAVIVVIITGFIFMMGYLLYKISETLMVIPGYLTIVISMLAELGIYGKEDCYEEDGTGNNRKTCCKDS